MEEKIPQLTLTPDLTQTPELTEKPVAELQTAPLNDQPDTRPEAGPELAQLSCMSVPSFCKKFKEQTKMTVTQYINEKRVAYASTLLKQSNYSLEEVAELTGFSNTNYLLRVFKKSTGKTIGQFRKQIRF